MGLHKAAGGRSAGFAARMLRFKLVRFGFVGALAGLTDLLLFWILNQQFGVHRIVAQCISRPTGGLVSYTANRFWTFGNRGRAASHVQFLRYAVIWLSSFLLSTVLLEGYRRLLPGDARFDFTAKILAEGTVGLLSFLAQRFWAFR